MLEQLMLACNLPVVHGFVRVSAKSMTSVSTELGWDVRQCSVHSTTKVLVLCTIQVLIE